LGAGHSSETRVISPEGKTAGEIAGICAPVLKEGGVIAYPTESCYGLGADAMNEKAVRRIHDIKGQAYTKPVSVIVGNTETAARFGVIGKKEKALISRFMPGPLTLIVRKRKAVPDILSRKTLGLRISSHPVADAIAKRFGSAITATSANLHGESEIYSGRELTEKFKGRVDLIVDAGKLPQRKPSSVYDAVNGKLLREGKITKKEIEESLVGK
jgi:L-threonylcarbamoyladenylate synthase